MLGKTLAAVGAIGICGSLAMGGISGERFDLFVFENSDGVGTGNIDIWVEVVNLGASVDFVWHNDSTETANLTQIYIENSSVSGLLVNAQILNGGGVNYAQGASPGSPAGSIQFFGGSWGGSVFDADPTTPQPNVNAINAGESLTTRFDLSGLLTYADLLGALAGGDGVFRLAGHVQGIGAGGASIWIVTPSPASGTLMLGGLLCATRRRR